MRRPSGPRSLPRRSPTITAIRELEQRAAGLRAEFKQLEQQRADAEQKRIAAEKQRLKESVNQHPRPFSQQQPSQFEQKWDAFQLQSRQAAQRQASKAFWKNQERLIDEVIATIPGGHVQSV